MKGYRDGLTQLSASSMHSPQPSAEVLDSWVPSVQLVDTYTFNITLSQVFSPAQVIFAGVGVLLSVSILFDYRLEAIHTLRCVTGSQGC